MDTPEIFSKPPLPNQYEGKSNQELIGMNEDKDRKIAELENLAYKDTLTGAYSRLVRDDQFFRMVAAAERSERIKSRSLETSEESKNETTPPLTPMIMSLDLNKFKKLNDKYGHAVGDEALKFLSQLSKDILRSGDFFCRVGGDEFQILFNTLTPAQAAAVCNRLQEAYSKWSHELTPLDQKDHPTVSFGLAVWQKGLTPDELIRRSDVASYVAKRNNIEVVEWSPMIQEEYDRQKLIEKEKPAER